MKAFAQRWSLILVIVTGLILGYYVVRTFVSPLPRQYQLDFADAAWVESPEPAPISYFRKEIFVSAVPEQAWLQVAATDSYKLFVNGHLVGMESLFKTRVAGIYDIKTILKPGTNVIALSVYRISYPGSAQILVRGAIKERGGKSLSIVSGPQWRVTPRTGIVEGSEQWNSAIVEEETWPNASLADVPEYARIDWVDVNPAIIQLAPSGSWISTEDARSEASFSKVIQAQRRHQDTWIEVASSGTLDLLVNGHLITAPDIPSLGAKGPPPLPVVTVEPSITGIEELTPNPTVKTDAEAEATPAITLKPASNPASTPALGSSPTPSPSLRTSEHTLTEPPTLQIFDVSYWIKKGDNTIVAVVRGNLQPASFLANGFTMRGDRNPEVFATDSTWQAIVSSPISRSPHTYAAIEGPRNGSAPWGPLAQRVSRPIERTDFQSIIKPALTVVCVVAVLLVLWMLFFSTISAVDSAPVAQVAARDAVLHAPIAVGLLLLLLPGYDYRFPQDWSFRPAFVLAGFACLLGIRLIHLVPLRSLGIYIRTAPSFKHFFYNAAPYCVLALIMGLGLALRYHDLGFMSFDHDEMGLVQKSKGILKLGFPYSIYGGELKPATTYELVTYPLAFSGWLFGYSEWSMRLPSCIWGTLTIGVMGLMGMRLFNWRTGLAAAIIYACMPLNIRWGQNAFYPQQCQFLAMLTFWFFYEAIRTRPFNNRFLSAATACFCATYLSWEGTAFILPALLIALIVVRWGEWWWLKQFHLYRCLFFIMVVVGAQFCSRTYFVSPYLQVGFGLSNLKGPSLFFLTSLYQPLYYVYKLFLSEGHVPFTLLVLLGLPFCWRDRAWRYLVVVLFVVFRCHTDFLAALSPRYCYYYQALLILSGVAVAIKLYDTLLALARAAGDFALPKGVAHASGLALLLLIFSQSNEWLFKDYMLSATEGQNMDLMARTNIYRYDYRGAADFVMQHIQPGDLLVPGFPHVFEFYSHRTGDYFLDTLLHSKIPYNEKLAEPVFVDKFSGYPAIRNLAELEEVTHHAKRTWIIFAPYATFATFSSPEVLDYLDKNAKVVFESYRAKVLLIQGAPHEQSTLAAQGGSG